MTTGYSVVADYTANRKYTTNPETGRREEHAQMISSELQRKSCQSFQNIKEQRYMEVG